MILLNIVDTGILDMFIIFRTDASKDIGTGHVMRCLSLAGALADKGADVVFICNNHEGNLCRLIKEKGFTVKIFPLSENTFLPDENPVHSKLPVEDWQEDARLSSLIIRDLDKVPDWLVVDHYSLDLQWESRLRPFVKNIFVIDDIADRNHDCDILLDQNLVEDMQNRYVGKVPEGCQLLLGPEYALLQPIYAELHERIPPREGPLKRILISFGRADNHNLTWLALSAFISLNRPNIEVDVVISESSQYRSEIVKLASGHDNIHLHGSLPTLAYLMAKADLAIGAAGTTSWERLCLGLPAIVIILAENQTAIAKGLQNAGLVKCLGDKKEISEEKIRDSLSISLENNSTKELSNKCKKLVDGKGAKRIATVLTITPDIPLIVRHAQTSDEKLLLSWVNDPETRHNSFSSEFISPEVHHIWFNNKLGDVGKCSIYILETGDGVPIGQIRFEKNGSVWEIDYSLSPDFRRRNLGKSLLKKGLFKFRSEHLGVLVVGRVKLDNIPSRKVFESLDFEKFSGGKEVVYKCLL